MVGITVGVLQVTGYLDSRHVILRKGSAVRFKKTPIVQREKKQRNQSIGCQYKTSAGAL